MKTRQIISKKSIYLYLLFLMLPTMFVGNVSAQNLDEIKGKGVLRHLGVKYANFVTGSGDGLDVELMQLFAEYLGVEYVYVQTSWSDVIGDLTGKRVKAKGDDIEIIEDVPIKGDIIANGLTKLNWREKVIDYSDPTFPSQVWLIAKANSSLKPITPTGNIDEDIKMTKEQLKDQSVLAVSNTCLDPKLYQLSKTGADIRLFTGNLNQIAPAVIKGDASSSILDVPDALVALEKWAGEIKVIGPVSHQQVMGTAFRKDSPELKTEFKKFFTQCKDDGTYLRLINKYYPAVFDYFSEFFSDIVK
ncbi:MAG: transporter substrate-binding domain-containing protein [Candidatus Omnitrophica bacterium]|nr:transporter substrate-binding domain-containing protein [Candidatus Omnitrophota bacterium]